MLIKELAPDIGYKVPLKYFKLVSNGYGYDLVLSRNFKVLDNNTKNHNVLILYRVFDNNIETNVVNISNLSDFDEKLQVTFENTDLIKKISFKRIKLDVDINQEYYKIDLVNYLGYKEGYNYSKGFNNWTCNWLVNVDSEYTKYYINKILFKNKNEVLVDFSYFDRTYYKYVNMIVPFETFKANLNIGSNCNKANYIKVGQIWKHKLMYDLRTVQIVGIKNNRVWYTEVNPERTSIIENMHMQILFEDYDKVRNGNRTKLHNKFNELFFTQKFPYRLKKGDELISVVGKQDEVVEIKFQDDNEIKYRHISFLDDYEIKELE